MINPHLFQLKVIKINSGCNFELSWGEGNRIDAQIDYPDSLTTGYQDWLKAYLNCYRNLRGKVPKSGTIKVKQDFFALLREAEAKFLSDFHSWLRGKELYDLRQTITNAAQPHNIKFRIDLLITCTDEELTRLPWEAWEISTNLCATGTIRIARVPSNIRQVNIPPLRRRARILAILGDEEGLDFREDKEALDHLSHLAQVKFIGWQKGKDNSHLKEEIAREIANPGGWDMLFFAGHSNETKLTGGEIHLAPKISIAINELKKPLQKAIENGLKFAIFNSCEGTKIAETLMDLGLPQVAVMREPVHNRVAQIFLWQFLGSLAQYKDVQEALHDASGFLKEEQNLTYPSTYLIPSLFRHPQSSLFQLQPFGIRQSLQSWLPTKREAVGLGICLALSLIPWVEDLLLEARLLVQAGYRQVTKQVMVNPSGEGNPPSVVLVQIDRESLKEDNVELIYDKYMNYGYLGKILDKLVAEKAPVIGFDYILDREDFQPTEAMNLRQAVDNAVRQNTWLVWGAIEGEDLGISPKIASLNQTLSGDVETHDLYVEQPRDNCRETCPFAYVLALATSLRSQDTFLQPAQSKEDFRRALVDVSDFKQGSVEAGEQGVGRKGEFFGGKRAEYKSISTLFQWFQPLIDFSLPPEQVYHTVSACKLLGSCDGDKEISELNLPQSIVIVAAGGYYQAGVYGNGEDNRLLPPSVAFWREEWDEFGKETFTGGEIHSYIAHHFLHRHLVIPVPNFLMILLVALVGKALSLIRRGYPESAQWWWIGLWVSWLVYVGISLQVFIWLRVLLPTLMPLVVWRVYGAAPQP